MGQQMGQDEQQRPQLVGVWQGNDLAQLSWIQHLFRKVVSDWTFDRTGDFEGDNAVLVARYVNIRQGQYFTQFRGRRVFLVDLADENYDFRPDVYSNFLGVFRCYWSNVFRRERMFPIPLGMTHHDFGITRSFPKSSERQFIWSFLGQLNKSSRPEMARYLRSLEPHLLFAVDETKGLSTWNVMDGKRRKWSFERCTDILLDSVFAPAPMGNVNLESWRVYEALETGAIPILEKRPTLDYFIQMWGEHPIPTVSSWKEARSLIAEIMASSVDLDRLQSECTNWWAARREEWSESICAFIQRLERMPVPTGPRDFVHSMHSRAGWQIVELLRHHSFPAMKRRLNLQLARLLSGKKLRVFLGADRNIKRTR